ncbi:MAG TPA: ABC transporter substrate-binding protein [Anaerolineaceae bacterium]|jgi:iron complex transport system substrate-binding protein|nr:ABC transporter substrate-binding protein [Anaerolineaceae bacterium]
MKKVISLIVLLVLVGLVACEPLQSPVETAPEVEAGPVYVPDDQSVTPGGVVDGKALTPVTIDYAKNFTLQYKDGYKILTVTQPWVGASQAFTYILVPEGVAEPANPGSAMVIHTPIQSLVTLSTTYFAFLENIGKLDTVQAVDDATYTYNKTITEGVKAGRVKVIGGGSSLGPIDLEALVDMSPDVIMTSASGSVDYDAHPKLLEAGFHVVINADYLENSPLGRAEWGKFIAAFYNEEERAAEQFSEVVARYNALKELAATAATKPTVFVNTDYQGTWYMPGNESYVAELLRDSGANYLFTDLPSANAAPLAFEEVYDRALNADYWLNVGFPADLAGLVAMDERYADFKAFQAGGVFNFNARVNGNGGVDYYESGVAHPDLVLSDLVKIFHPELLPDYTLYYYKQLN